MGVILALKVYFQKMSYLFDATMNKNMTGCLYQMPRNVVLSGKFPLLICKNLSENMGKQSTLRMNPPPKGTS